MSNIGMKKVNFAGVLSALVIDAAKDWQGYDITNLGDITVNNLITAGNVDGRDVSVDGTKLDGIETAATADQTKADIDALGLSHDSLADVSTSDHHVKYTDAEAVAAVVAENPLTLTNGLTIGGTLDMQENIIDNVGDIFHDDATASDWTLKNQDLDKDIIFNVNDGTVDKSVAMIDGSEGALVIMGGNPMLLEGPGDTAQLKFATPSVDANSDKNLVISAIGVDKNIIFSFVPTGTANTVQSAFQMFGTDFNADSANTEKLLFVGGAVDGSPPVAEDHYIESAATGTGTVRDLHITTRSGVAAPDDTMIFKSTNDIEVGAGVNWDSDFTLGVGKVFIFESSGSADVVKVYSPSSAGAGEKAVRIVPFGTNKSMSLQVIPSGTGAANLYMYGTDREADGTNIELLQITAGNTISGFPTDDHCFISEEFGNKTVRNMHFCAWRGNTKAEIMTVDCTNDRVGIGTITPDGILHLDNGASDTDLIIEKDAATQARIVFHNAGTERANIRFDASEDIVIENDNQDTDIVFKVNDGGVDTEVMRIDGDVSNLVFGDSRNITFDTTTGTKIGTGTTQKIGFWNTAPAVQPAHIVDADGTLGDVTTKFNTLLAQLATTGLQAAA